MARMPLRLTLSTSALLAAVVSADAGSTLEARYTVTFTGVTLGQGALVVEVNEEGYSAAGSAMVAGLLQMITGGKGTAAEKMSALAAAGVRVVNSPADIGTAVKSVL